MEALGMFAQGTLGALIMALSGMVWLIVVLIAFPVVAFQKTWWWGVLCLVFAGPATLIFSIVYFKESWKLLLVGAVSLGLTMGIFMLRTYISTTVVSETEVSQHLEALRAMLA